MLGRSMPKRGRPVRKRLRKRSYSVSEFSEITGQSRSTIFRQMAAGLLRFTQSHPGGARRIPDSEFVRLGFDLPEPNDAA